MEHRPDEPGRDDGSTGPGKKKFTAGRTGPTRRASPSDRAPDDPGPDDLCRCRRHRRRHFRNKVSSPVTIHPHGILYSQEMDGAYKGRYTDPAASCRRSRPSSTSGRRYRGRRARGLPRPRADGADAGVQGPVRALIIRPAGSTPPDRSVHRLPLVHPARDGPADRVSRASTATRTRATPRRSRPAWARTSPSTSSRSTTTSTPSTSTATAGWTSPGRSSTTGHSARATRSRLVRRGQPRPVALPLPRLVPHHRGMNGWYIVQ